MSYDKYERGCQHLNSGHQRITYKKNDKNKKMKIKILTLRLAQSNQWVGADHATQIQLLNSPPITGSVEKNKVVVMMTVMI